jgi:ABC-type multidrug transport system ATPase subunit
VVIVSLHQPSREMFFSLDRVLLMGHGRILFSGRPEEAEGGLAARGLTCPEGTAIAEHLLKVCVQQWGRKSSRLGYVVFSHGRRGPTR